MVQIQLTVLPNSDPLNRSVSYIPQTENGNTSIPHWDGVKLNQNIVCKNTFIHLLPFVSCVILGKYTYSVPQFTYLSSIHCRGAAVKIS